MMAIFSFLRPYLGYIFIAAAAGGWFLWHDHQEIDKGEARVVAAQKAADVKEAAHVAKVEADDKVTIDGLKMRLDNALAIPDPVPGVVVRMCLPASRLSADAGSGGKPAGPGSDGPAGPGGSVGSADPDIAGLTEKILADDGAIIAYLQGYIASCQADGVCGKTPKPLSK